MATLHASQRATQGQRPGDGPLCVGLLTDDDPVVRLSCTHLLARQEPGAAALVQARIDAAPARHGTPTPGHGARRHPDGRTRIHCTGLRSKQRLRHDLIGKRVGLSRPTITFQALRDGVGSVALNWLMRLAQAAAGRASNALYKAT